MPSIGGRRQRAHSAALEERLRVLTLNYADSSSRIFTYSIYV